MGWVEIVKERGMEDACGYASVRSRDRYTQGDVLCPAKCIVANLYPAWLASRLGYPRRIPRSGATTRLPFSPVAVVVKTNSPS